MPTASTSSTRSVGWGEAGGGAAAGAQASLSSVATRPAPQYGEDTFNRAKLLNVGFLEALKDDEEYDCFIFSDVDLIPMDDRNLYRCYEQPRHFAVGMDKFGFRWVPAGWRCFGDGLGGFGMKPGLPVWLLPGAGMGAVAQTGHGLAEGTEPCVRVALAGLVLVPASGGPCGAGPIP